MERERIFLASNSRIATGALKAAIEASGKVGHKVVGEAHNFMEMSTTIRAMVESGITPSVFMLDPEFPETSDGQVAVSIVRRFFPEIKVVSLASRKLPEIGEDMKVDFGISNRKAVDLGGLITKFKYNTSRARQLIRKKV